MLISSHTLTEDGNQSSGAKNTWLGGHLVTIQEENAVIAGGGGLIAGSATLKQRSGNPEQDLYVTDDYG